MNNQYTFSTLGIVVPTPDLAHLIRFFFFLLFLYWLNCSRILNVFVGIPLHTFLQFVVCCFASQFDSFKKTRIYVFIFFENYFVFNSISLDHACPGTKMSKLPGKKKYLSAYRNIFCHPVGHFCHKWWLILKSNTRHIVNHMGYCWNKTENNIIP